MMKKTLTTILLGATLCTILVSGPVFASLVHRLAAYKAIKELSSDKGYPVDKLCKYLNITRSAYYHWLKHPKSNNELQNETLSIEIQKIHKEHPDMGYRRIRDELDGHKGIHVNDKRVLRICRKYDIKSKIKWKPKSCTRGERNPDHIAKNYLHRDFHADKPNEKWLTRTENWGGESEQWFWLTPKFFY